MDASLGFSHLKPGTHVEKHTRLAAKCERHHNGAVVHFNGVIWINKIVHCKVTGSMVFAVRDSDSSSSCRSVARALPTVAHDRAVPRRFTGGSGTHSEPDRLPPTSFQSSRSLVCLVVIDARAFRIDEKAELPPREWAPRQGRPRLLSCWPGKILTRRIEQSRLVAQGLRFQIPVSLAFNWLARLPEVPSLGPAGAQGQSGIIGDRFIPGYA